MALVVKLCVCMQVMTAAAEEAKRRGEDDKIIQKLEQMKAVLEKGGEFALVVKLGVKLVVKIVVKRVVKHDTGKFKAITR